MFYNSSDIILVLNFYAKKKNLLFEELAGDKEFQIFLVSAILGNDTHVSAFLQKSGNSVNAYDSFHRTPLFWATTMGPQQCC